MMIFPLSQLAKLDIGQVFKVHSFSGDELFKLRLLEMGFHEGDELQYKGRAPFSGPFIIEIDGAYIALREEEAECLRILRTI